MHFSVSSLPWPISEGLESLKLAAQRFGAASAAVQASRPWPQEVVVT